MHRIKGLALNKTDANITPSTAKSAKGANPKCTGAVNPKYMGATGKEPPPASAAKKHAGRGVSLTWVGLNPNNWHAGVNPKYMGAMGREIPPPAPLCR